MIIFLCCCNNDESNDNFNATVIVRGLDCAGSYLIKFDDNLSNVPKNSSENVFYEINLPNQYKIEGLRINVLFRLPTKDETMVCTAKDYSYPQIFIDKINIE
jgi:hypothetical protein